MKNATRFSALIFLLLGLTSGKGEWGFYGHRLINKMAVYTLPPEMLTLFKPNLEFISDHAVDPDKRRYASPFEAIRHYIDLDHWGSAPFEELPRNWIDALAKHCDVVVYSPNGDSLRYHGDELWKENDKIDSIGYRDFFVDQILPNYYEENWTLECETWSSFWPDNTNACATIEIVDNLSPHGILPYFLPQIQHRLTEAFRKKEKQKIIRLSAEIGHYLGDAHVPLHVTKNYNGQLTDQVGIHAFWETRIPELFAESDYDFFVGKANYVDNPTEYYWDIVLSSSALVDSVLVVEKRLSETFPSDRQYCFDNRLDMTVRTQCKEYAQKYQDLMQGMVEQRMRESIHAIGSIWYTCWIDAGQPNFAKDRSEVADGPTLGDDFLPEKSRRIKRRKHE